MQQIYFYIDDSGVFAQNGNTYFNYSGYVFWSKESKDNAARIYSSVERKIKKHLCMSESDELKSFGLEIKHKRRLFSTLNKFHRFSCIVIRDKIDDPIWEHKKHKQRFLDYALKLTIKETIKQGYIDNFIDLKQPVSVNVFFDQHTTATSGLYEFKEGLFNELISGTYNFRFKIFYPPILVKGSIINVQFCNSCNHTLIRASDVVANRIFFELNNNGEDPYGVWSKLRLFFWKSFP